MQIKPPSILYKRGAAWLAFLGPFFFLSYGAVNYFTSTRSDVGIIVANWERAMPFVPWLMLPYMSIDAFYAGSLFLFRRKKALDIHAKRLLLATVISLFGFLLFPLQFSFAVPKAEGFNGILQAALLGFDKPYNQAPSLHISLLIVLWVCYASKLAGFWRLALHGWFLAIGASVLLAYQHHFIDVWTGAIVGVAVLYLIPDAPFAWRWQAPTARMRQLGLRYSLLAAVAGLAAFFVAGFSGLLTVILAWVAVSLSLVAAAYFGFGKHIFQRKKGQISWPAKLLLTPYLAGSWLSYRWHLRNKIFVSKITETLYLSAYPSKQVLTNLRIQHVLDLTNEFTQAAISSAKTYFLPVMDLTPPSPKTLVRAVRWLEKAQINGNVLVHCALGLSRSASVIVCWLVWRGHAKSVADAILQVTEKRAGLVLNAQHIANIEAALLLLKKP
jgi:protein-tyrosine phosphatase